MAGTVQGEKRRCGLESMMSVNVSCQLSHLPKGLSEGSPRGENSFLLKCLFHRKTSKITLENDDSIQNSFLLKYLVFKSQN